MEEIWIEIKGYKGLYEISSNGRIRGFYKKGKFEERIINYHMSGVLRRNYPQISLYKNGLKKTLRVHYLMALCFLDYIKTDRKTVIDHIDNNPLNNNINNLQIVSMAYNNIKDKKK
jgi:hypothetical protein